MKFHYCLILFILTVPIVVNTGCNNTQEILLQDKFQQANQITSRDVQETNVNNLQNLTKKDGWKIPSLAQSRITKSRNLFENGSNSSVKMFWTWYKPSAKNGQSVIIKDEELSKEERKLLGLPTGDLIVMDMIQYDVNNHPFCYLVRIHPKGIGAIQGLHYYDLDSDGRFEAVEKGTALPSFVPLIPSSN